MGRECESPALARPPHNLPVHSRLTLVKYIRLIGRRPLPLGDDEGSIVAG